MAGKGWHKACIAELKRHRGLAVIDRDGAIWFEGIADNVHDVDYDNQETRWVEGGFMHERAGILFVHEDGSVYLVPHIEADDSFKLRFTVEQPAELAEFIDFYRQAKEVIARPAVMHSVSLDDVIDETALVLLIRSKCRLLPVSGKILDRLPGEIIGALERHLAGGDLTGLPCWSGLGDKWADVLKPLTRPMGREFAYCGPASGLKPVAAGASCGGDWELPQLWFKPRDKGLSWTFWGEYFRYTTEGNEALKRLWSGGRLRGLARRMKTIHITVPKERLQQIRRAVEWRSARLACLERMQELVSKGSPAASRTNHLADILARTNRVGHPASGNRNSK